MKSEQKPERKPERYLVAYIHNGEDAPCWFADSVQANHPGDALVFAQWCEEDLL